MYHKNAYDIQKFKDSIEKSGVLATVDHVLNKNVTVEYDKLPYFNLTQLEEFILSLKPNSPKAITTICYVLGLYAKWLTKEGITDHNFYETIQSVSRTKLWKVAKANVKNKFLSYRQYESLLHDIGMYEEFNAFYYQTLIKSIYEGIYSGDMSVIKNLRASDIRHHTVTLKDDNGSCYDLEISDGLVEDLRELSDIDTWQRKNRFRSFPVPIIGEYSDSCFKLERRNDSPDLCIYAYYAKIRKIAKEYLERNILPLNIYISGIMYRIKLKLEDNDITLRDAFSEGNRNRLVGSIIATELSRCHYSNTVNNFRELVGGHIDEFLE